MKIETFYCNYCDNETEYNFKNFPCDFCIKLLKKKLEENKKYNTFEAFDSKLLIPKNKAFTGAICDGEAKYIKYFMKRLARKAGKYT